MNDKKEIHVGYFPIMEIKKDLKEQVTNEEDKHLKYVEQVQKDYDALWNKLKNEEDKLQKAIDWCDERCENIHMVGNFSSFTIGEKHGIEMVKQYLQSLNQ